jgi:hypothetical protein
MEKLQDRTRKENTCAYQRMGGNRIAVTSSPLVVTKSRSMLSPKATPKNKGRSEGIQKEVEAEQSCSKRFSVSQTQPLCVHGLQ